MSLAGKKGSELAKEIAAVGAGKSQFAGLAGVGGPANLLLNFTLPPGMQKALASSFDEVVKDGLKKDKDEARREAHEKLLKALGPTVKAGSVDAAVSLRGPSPEKHYGFVAALGLKDGEQVDQVLRDIAKNLHQPDFDKKVKLDAETIQGVKVHRINAQEDMRGDVKKKLGSEPFYLALRNNAAFLAGGEGGLEALKQALSAEPGDALPLKVDVSVAGIAALMDKEKHKKDPAQVASEVFGSSGAHDKIHFALKGGEAIQLRLDADADALKFFAQVGGGEQKSKKPADE
jgi:hypothetical protein